MSENSSMAKGTERVHILRSIAHESLASGGAIVSGKVKNWIHPGKRLQLIQKGSERFCSNKIVAIVSKTI